MAGQLAQSVMQCTVSTPCIFFIFISSSSSSPSIHSCEGKSKCGSLCHYIKSQNEMSLLCYGRRVISTPLLWNITLFSFLWLRLRLAIPFVFLSFRASLTRCQSLGRSRTTAPGSASRGAGRTRWLPCSRSSTGPRSGCWKPSVYASAAPSDGHLLWRCPPAGTGRCPVYRMCLDGQKEVTQERVTQLHTHT